MRRFATFLITAVATIGAVQAETLDFDGTAQSTCALTSPSNGTITLQGDLRSWATATPASIIVTNTAAGAYDLTITNGASWATSPAGTPTTTFAHTQAITGVNSSVQFNSSGASTNATLANAGQDNVSISLTATSPDPFRAGAHKAQVTVTCAAP